MRKRRIDGAEVSAIGFGAMNLSISGRPPDEQGVRVIHTALDAGMTLIDTADCYCLDDSDFHHNERLLARALRERPGWRQGLLIATKAGYVRPAGRWVENGRPEHIRRTAEESLRALETDSIDLLQLHTPDPKVPLEETLGVFADLQREGKARMIGLSNVSLAELDRAQRVVEVVSVQNEYSPLVRDPERDGVLRACEERGIAFLPWGPLGGRNRAPEIGRTGTFGRGAERLGVSPQRLILAWMLARSPVIIPIPGSRRVETVLDSAAAAELELSQADVAELEGGLR